MDHFQTKKHLFFLRAVPTTSYSSGGYKWRWFTYYPTHGVDLERDPASNPSSCCRCLCDRKRVFSLQGEFQQKDVNSHLFQDMIYLYGGLSDGLPMLVHWAVDFLPNSCFWVLKNQQTLCLRDVFQNFRHKWMVQYRIPLIPLDYLLLVWHMENPPK